MQKRRLEISIFLFRRNTKIHLTVRHHLLFAFLL